MLLARAESEPGTFISFSFILSSLYVLATAASPPGFRLVYGL
jgi:hypothetical protein